MFNHQTTSFPDRLKKPDVSGNCPIRRPSVPSPNLEHRPLGCIQARLPRHVIGPKPAFVVLFPLITLSNKFARSTVTSVLVTGSKGAKYRICKAFIHNYFLSLSNAPGGLRSLQCFAADALKHLVRSVKKIIPRLNHGNAPLIPVFPCFRSSLWNYTFHTWRGFTMLFDMRERKGEFLFARWTLLRDYSPPDIKELGSGSALLVCFRIGRAPDYLDPLVGRIFES
uniref:Pentatricopeptide repeat-containing protein n=1 Tax=Steinernema glaseri TaxID=37863 RepID=A0A1I7YII1_9BILA